MIPHAFLSALWTLAGVWLLSQGRPPLGPTASGATAMVLFVVIVIYFFALTKADEKLFLVLSSLAAIVGLLTIYGALTKDHSLWPAEFWRYAGIAVNALAVIGFTLAVKSFVLSKVDHQK